MDLIFRLFENQTGERVCVCTRMGAATPLELWVHVVTNNNMETSR